MDHFWGDGDDEGEWRCVKKNKMIKDKKKKTQLNEEKRVKIKYRKRSRA